MAERSWRTKLLILAAILSVWVVLPVSALLWMTAVPGRSFAGTLPPLTPAQAQLAVALERHVRAVASVPHNVRHPAALEQAALHIEGALAGSGYRVVRQSFRAGPRMVRNIEAVIEPATAGAETLVIGAHYDSYANVAGANDNGSGTAAVIELARMLADLRGRSALRIRLVLFVNEEPPFFKSDLMGSLIYARHLKRSGEPLMGMLSLETMGFYSDAPNSQHYPPPLGALYPKSGDFVAFVGTTGSRAFVRRTVGAFRAAAPRRASFRGSTGPITGRSTGSACRR